MQVHPFPIRVYADTSVFGGVFDAEFERGSRAFFGAVDRGRVLLVTSALVEQELRDGAPAEVMALFERYAGGAARCAVTPEVLALQDAYIASGVVGPNHANDALHVALASWHSCRIIVSWNFKHIVRFDKIPHYNAVNIARSLAPILIHSPSEVSYGVDAEEDV